VVGSSVFLKGCPYGKPGRVLKVSHGKAKVWWVDLDYIGHHACNSLMLAPTTVRFNLDL
jgi:extradiol dioxygenase family protein